MRGKKLFAVVVATTITMSCAPMPSVQAMGNAQVIQQHGVAALSIFNVEASYQEAVSKVKISKYDEPTGSIPVSTTLMTHLDNSNLTGIQNATSKIIEVGIQLKDAYLASSYRNGASPAGESYYNFLNYYTDVLQVKQLMDDNPGYRVKDAVGKIYNVGYVDELLALLEQINSFDTSTNLRYDTDSIFDATAFATDPSRGGSDVIATSENGNATLRFHIDSHGWWGYDLGAHDSITGVVMGYDADYARTYQHDLTVKYGNFFVIEMPNSGPGKLYQLNGTDLENPMIYISANGKEAFMIDVDFYGENAINQVIKDVIGPDCEKLTIYLTHNHGDHVNNLNVIAKDDRLKDIVNIMWPENEPHTMLNGVDLVTLFGEDKVTTLADMEKFKACGHTFQFIEIPNEHTVGGGQLADLTNKVVYCGDTLGAQIHLGGTTVRLSTLDSWIADAQKSVRYVEDNDIEYYIGGHTPYLNTSQFSSWLVVATEYAKAQLAANPSWSGLVIVEKGQVVTGARLGEIFTQGLTDREELNILSVNFMNDLGN